MLNIVEWTKNRFLPLGGFGLFLLAFMEASFFPVPPDILLIVLSLLEPEKIWLFVLLCVLGSVLGGMFGYGIGCFCKYAFIEKLFGKKKLEGVHKMYNKYEGFTVFIGGFTPVPYKLITISAGLFYVNFFKFVVFAFLSRGLRFGLEGVLLYFFNVAIKNFLERYFGLFSIIVVIIIVIGYWLFYRRLKE